jgi:hypothetical protein
MSMEHCWNGNWHDTEVLAVKPAQVKHCPAQIKHTDNPMTELGSVTNWLSYSIAIQISTYPSFMTILSAHRML